MELLRHTQRMTLENTLIGIFLFMQMASISQPSGIDAAMFSGVYYAITTSCVIGFYVLVLKKYQRIEPNSGDSIEDSKTEADYRQLAPELVDDITKRIRNSMEQQRLYLESGLTLSQLAKHLDLQPQVLTIILNSYMKTNFYAYINGLRLEAFIDNITQRKDEPINITNLAYDAGFGNKTTFNRVFSQRFGQTPSQWLKCRSNS